MFGTTDRPYLLLGTLLRRRPVVPDENMSEDRAEPDFLRNRNLLLKNRFSMGFVEKYSDCHRGLRPAFSGSYESMSAATRSFSRAGNRFREIPAIQDPPSGSTHLVGDGSVRILDMDVVVPCCFRIQVHTRISVSVYGNVCDHPVRRTGCRFGRHRPSPSSSTTSRSQVDGDSRRRVQRVASGFHRADDVTNRRPAPVDP